MTTTVHLLRHGEVHNPGKVLYGRLPGFRLSAQGERMAEQAARWLAGRSPVALYVSPLERARQTVAPLEQLTGLTATVDPRLIESSNVFEGGVVEVGPGVLRHPRVWRHLGNPLRPSWGEPYRQVAARMLAAAADARDAARQAGEGDLDVVMVSHQLPIWTARRAAEGRRLWHRPDRRQCALASITSLVYEGSRLLRVDYVEPCGPSVAAPGSVGA